MSQINTNGINANYPVPGVNNSTQGFRDNFAQIRNQLSTAATEITDLQTKAVLKAALDNTTLNNDMGNALISNASTRGFRSTTYNLGNALMGTVLVDVNRADVQYGAVTGNVTLQFANWSPTNTESNVVLRLTVANTDAVISLPSSCVDSNNNFGVTLLENYAVIGNVATLTAPANTQILEYTFSTIDCGNTVTVLPENRPMQSTQIVKRDPAPTGLPGDVEGAVAVSANYLYVCTAPFNSDTYSSAVQNTYATGNLIQLGSTVNLLVNSPIIFSGNIDSANTTLVTDQVYYIKTINSANITVSDVRIAGVAGSAVTVGNTVHANAIATTYVGDNIWKRINLTSW